MKKTAITILIVVLLQSIMLGSQTCSITAKKYEPCSENKYQGNMLVVAQVKCLDDVILNCEVAVFDSNGECRASELSDPNDNGIVYLTVQGEGAGEPLSFRVVYWSDDSQEDILVEETATFVNDEVVGSWNEPFVLNVSKPESIEDIVADDIEFRSISDGISIRASKRQLVSVYNILGVCVFRQEVEGECNVSLPDGIYVANGKKLIVK